MIILSKQQTNQDSRHLIKSATKKVMQLCKISTYSKKLQEQKCQKKKNENR